MADIEVINRFSQNELRRRGLDRIPDVNAAQWLDQDGLLPDPNRNNRRRGLRLRNLLKDGQINGGRQEPPQPYGRWFIYRVDQ